MLAILQTINPLNGKMLEEIEETDLNNVPVFYEHSLNAFQKWSNLSIDERLTYLRALKHLIVEEMNSIVNTIVADTGKVPTDALVADVMPTIDGIEYVLKHAKKTLQPQKKENTSFINREKIIC